ncbi:DUF4233 domain-containing protein [Demequina activiva]|uniref:DUF4233 domain-containing protein n=1 Tax=Demequina activiva TaxID=1582364 RepID=A0A919Q2V0_9MICO|nr:DUF4233 domain-containing protein [Demequina activiva]GIG53283.1 hypothetical protein Dac01nite_00350 [Demequina activiva]
MTDQPQPRDAEAPAKPQRPATLVFTQAVLVLEAFAALFATLVAWSFARNGLIDAAPGWMLGGGVALMLALGYASGQQKRRWGRILGWILQVPMLLAGLIVPAIAVIGAVFLVIWIMGLRLGGRIDRERAERDAAASAGDAGGATESSQ